MPSSSTSASATTVQVSWIEFQAPQHAEGVPTDPEDPLFGKQCGCGCGCSDCGKPPDAPAAIKATDSPVRYSSGTVVLEDDDLHAGGFGAEWGHTRSFANRLTANIDVGNGVNWQVRQWSYLVFQEGGTVVVMGRANDALWFDPAGPGYSPRFSVRQSLALDAGAGLYRLTDLDGSVTEYDAATGTFRRHADPAGNSVAVVATTANGFNFTEVQRSHSSGGTTTTESFQYAYDDPAAGYPRLTSVLLRRQVNGGAWSNVTKVSYAYYGAGDPNGGIGDLKTVVKQHFNGSGWDSLGTTLYRYYNQLPFGSSSSSSSSSSGSAADTAHLVKYVVGPAAYDRLSAVADPLTAPDAVVAQYADNYFEYSSDRRVTLEKVDGGARAYSMSVVQSGNADGYNSWKTRTTETLPDGTPEPRLRQPRRPDHARGAYLRRPPVVRLLPLHRRRPAGHARQPLGGLRLRRAVRRPAARRRGQLRVPSGRRRPDPRLHVPLPDRQPRLRVGPAGRTRIADPAARVRVRRVLPVRSIIQFLQLVQFLLEGAGHTDVLPVEGDGLPRRSRAPCGSSSSSSGAPRRIVTSHAYAFHPGTVRVRQHTTTLPVVPTSQNGSGVADTRRDYFDSYGNLTWHMDERGFLTRTAYDVATGAMTQRIEDVDTTRVSDAPSGWSTPAGGGLHLVTDFTFDDEGRVTQVLGPSHTIDLNGTATVIRRASWTVYRDALFQTWSAQGYATGSSPNYTYTLVNPVSISITDKDGKATDQIQATRASTAGAIQAGDGFPQSSYVRWTTMQYGPDSMPTSRRTYSSIPSSGTGTAGTNYDQAGIGYDIMGRGNKQVTAGGTISRTVFDGRGNAVQQWTGTNDAGATDADPTGGGTGGNNMVQVSASEFDKALASGDNNLTKQTLYVDAGTTRVTTFLYDWRDRRTDTDGEVDYYEQRCYDNLGRILRTDRRDTTASGNLIARSETCYDDRGRVYRSLHYGVDPATGAVGNALTDNTWYDPSANVVKVHPSGSQLFTKSVFDGVGRQTKQYRGYDLAESSYATAFDVTGDTLLEQAETACDAAGNVIQTTTRQRYHDATGTGELGDPHSAQPEARVSYAATYSDTVGRVVNLADYGTNGGTALTRPATAPARSNVVLVSSTTYNQRRRCGDDDRPGGHIDMPGL